MCYLRSRKVTMKFFIVLFIEMILSTHSLYAYDELSFDLIKSKVGETFNCMITKRKYSRGDLVVFCRISC